MTDKESKRVFPPIPGRSEYDVPQLTSKASVNALIVMGTVALVCAVGIFICCVVLWLVK